jgi:hypothetical protein
LTIEPNLPTTAKFADSLDWADFNGENAGQPKIMTLGLLWSKFTDCCRIAQACGNFFRTWSFCHEFFDLMFPVGYIPLGPFFPVSLRCFAPWVQAAKIRQDWLARTRQGSIGMKLPTTHREPRQTQPPVETGELVLKIHGGTWHGRIIRLEALRCTVGSGPQCSLRMRLPGLAPLACEIDRTAEPALIRCWAAGVLLNGHPCQQALLSIGDRLSLGGMEFEILGGIAAALPWAGGLPEQSPKQKKKKTTKPEAKLPTFSSEASPAVTKATTPHKQDRV